MKDEIIRAESLSFADQRWFGRIWEILPGAMSWSTLLAPVILSFFAPVLVAYFIIGFDLVWMIKSFRLSFYLIRGYRRLYQAQRVDWNERLEWLSEPDKYVAKYEHKINSLRQSNPRVANRMQLRVGDRVKRLEYLSLIKTLEQIEFLREKQAVIIDPREIYNVVIFATYNEPYDIFQAAVESLLKAEYPLDRLMMVIGYEERGGQATEDNCQRLIREYGDKFAYALAVKHPEGVAGEVIGKGGNITMAGRQLAAYVEAQGIDPEKVIVTTLDADHQPHPQYFSYLTYAYASSPNRLHESFQPVPMFFNNIWYAPAPMRIIATGNSFWMIMESMRPHRLRNFAAHAQGLKTLLDTDFWSVISIVEDGHQYWRTYFTYDGDHRVVPLFIPVYQDAVLAENYRKTFRAQYKQLRRWSYGVSDLRYVVVESVKNKRIPWGEKLVRIWQLFEGHYSWATSALVLSFVAWLPLFLNPKFGDQVLAHQLPIIASRIQTVALVGLVVTVFISLLSLPPRPQRYRRTRALAMVTQWALLPFTAIVFSAFAALDSQTRLMLGRYMTVFQVTDKVRKR